MVELAFCVGLACFVVGVGTVVAVVRDEARGARERALRRAGDARVAEAQRRVSA